jgi:hypothetical protein
LEEHEKTEKNEKIVAVNISSECVMGVFGKLI